MSEMAGWIVAAGLVVLAILAVLLRKPLLASFGL